MANFLSTKIALRTDTIQNWNNLSNQILLNGEVAIVMTDEKLPLFKIGDGVHKFYELPYSNSKISSDMVNAVDIIAKSICQGANSSAVPQSLAAGLMVSSDVPYSQAFGYNTKTKSGDIYSFTWSGETSRDINKPYSSHAIGSFNINPNNGLSGFYIGDRNLKDIFESEISSVSKVALISNDVAYSKDLSVVKITGEEYYKLVADEKTNPSVLYVVDDPYLNAYGQTIKNVAFPELSNDAATKNYVDSEIAKIPQPDLTQFYKKSETSSSAEIANAIKNNIQVSAALDTGTQIASISVDGVATPIYAPEGGGRAEWGSIEGNVEDQKDLIKVNYPLDNPTESSETIDQVTYKRFDIKDHTIATISLSNETPVRIHFPDKPAENFCRDFIVKIKVTTDSIPQVQFIKGQNDTSIGFEYEDDSWAALEVGINYFTFTETERE